MTESVSVVEANAPNIGEIASPPKTGSVIIAAAPSMTGFCPSAKAFKRLGPPPGEVFH